MQKSMSLKYEPSSEPLHYDSYRITNWERMLKSDRYPKPFFFFITLEPRVELYNHL